MHQPRMTIPGRSTYHTGAHHVLTDDDEGPYGEAPLLAKAVEEDLRHRLIAVHDTAEVCPHAECQGHVDRCRPRLAAFSAISSGDMGHDSLTPAQDAGNTDGANNGPWDRSSCVGGLFADVHARVE